MAYSNYGAYTYFNGVDVTDLTCDKGYYYSDNRWLLCGDNDTALVGGHAVVPFGDGLLIEIYKTHTFNIWYKGKLLKRVNVERNIMDKYLFSYNIRSNRKKIEVDGVYIDSDESIIHYDISYDNNLVTVIVGSCFGNGWDKRLTSKYVKKHIRFNLEDGISRIGKYYPAYYAIDYYRRKEEIKDIIHDVFKFGCLDGLFYKIRYLL